MGIDLVEALVVERGHQLGIDRLAIGILDGECPFFLLTRCQSVTEGGPLQLQTLVGQGTADSSRVGIAKAVLHPRKGEQQAVFIILIILQLEVKQSVALVDSPLLDQFLAGKEAVDDMHISIGRAYLHRHGLAVIGELVGREPEPVLGFCGRHLVICREEHELTLRGIILEGSLQHMLSRCEFLNHDRTVGLDFLPCSLIYAVFHLGVEVLAGSIEQMDGGLGLVFLQDLLCQVDAQGLFTIAQRQREFTAMGLTRRISNISRHHKVVEHRIAGLGHLQRHGHIKRTIIARGCLTPKDLVSLITVVQRGGIPVTAVAPPPEGSTAHHLIADLRPLYRYTGIAHGRTLHCQGVASGIQLFHFGEVDMERRALILLHTETVALVPHLEGKPPRQSRRGQGEIGSSRTIGIRHGLLFLDHLIVGIAQDKGQRGLAPDRVPEALDHIIENGRGMNGLTRTIDGAVGIDTGALLQATVAIVSVAESAGKGRTGLIVGGIGKSLHTVVGILGMIDILTLGIGHGVVFKKVFVA